MAPDPDPELQASSDEDACAIAQCMENHQEDALDEALAATFPSSDPIAISIT